MQSTLPFRKYELNGLYIQPIAATPKSVHHKRATQGCGCAFLFTSDHILWFITLLFIIDRLDGSIDRRIQQHTIEMVIPLTIAVAPERTGRSGDYLWEYQNQATLSQHADRLPFLVHL
jgi:hypothetical protein